MHIPVLQKEINEFLNPKPNENFIDATIGEGGHTLVILEKNQPNGKVLGIEWDAVLYQKLKKETANLNLRKRLILVNDSYSNLKEIIKMESFQQISGILFDLGMSSWHLEESGRGFSFLRKEPLDMRYNLQSSLTAEDIVNYWPVQEIERILKECSQERFAKIIAKKISEERKKKPIKDTFQLIEIIRKSVPKNYEMGRIHPATRTFQTLRIVVNNELENLKKVLPQTLGILEPKGKLAVISFHSLEERIVKHFLQENAKKNLIKILTKKPIIPSREEIKLNSRARSAKLRVAMKI